jgi:hypothetical protein
MSNMTEGLRNVAHSAIDTVEEVALTLMQGGVDPKEAVKAAAIFTKSSVDKLIRDKFEHQSASSITHNIKSEGSARQVLN